MNCSVMNKPGKSSTKEAQHETIYGKQSSGDLQSRLKTRKLLGVGECEDGSVPLSKISQILGSDDHYIINMPAGLRLWQVTTAVVFTSVSLLSIFFPVTIFNMLFSSGCGNDAVLPLRLFGAALICLALLFWSSVKSVSRYIIRWTLLAEVLYLSLQVMVVWFTLWDTNHFSFPSLLVVVTMVMAIIISLYFYSILAGITFKTLLKGRALFADFTQNDKFD
ncbi:tumor protein p53-inducible protein 11-like isoform X1 [Lytechinus variegatus]|uniref:tumor protein p53-inducible protein 11-like isoform X1 n=1 Tax=Lytechinus variegatus TaxID=7654 RepID=UPI001BB25922|nr:tumor protein p53-inducible protein 11-like isoform X1 [Lytechinus variegatus]